MKCERFLDRPPGDGITNAAPVSLLLISFANRGREDFDEKPFSASLLSPVRSG
jgi:hypothetical protein